MAYPACGFPLGGYNQDDKDKNSYYASSFTVPLPGSYVFVFFEGGNIDQCYYFASWLGKQSQQNEKSINPVKAPPENRGADSSVRAAGYHRCERGNLRRKNGRYAGAERNSGDQPAELYWTIVGQQYRAIYLR